MEGGELLIGLMGQDGIRLEKRLEARMVESVKFVIENGVKNILGLIFII